VGTPIAGKWSHRVEGWKLLASSLGLSILGVLLTLVPSLVVVLFGVMLCSTGVFPLSGGHQHGASAVAAARPAPRRWGSMSPSITWVGSSARPRRVSCGNWGPGRLCGVHHPGVGPLPGVCVATVWRRQERHRARSSALDLGNIAT
jgi:hypothetical protein